jgi:hypothetical protein
VLSDGNVGIGTILPRAALDVSGSVRMINPPIMSSPYAWSYKGDSVAYSITYGNYIPFNTPIIASVNFNISTYKFTTPVKGYYWVSFNVRAEKTNNDEYFRAELLKNGVVLQHTMPIHYANGVYTTSSGSWLIQLNANDELGLIALFTDNVGIINTIESSFNGFCLCQIP